MSNNHDPGWNFKHTTGSSSSNLPALRLPSYPVPGHHLRSIYIKAMKAIVQMEVQSALERRAIYYNMDLYLFAVNALDDVFGRIFDLFYGKTRTEPHQEQLKQFIQITLVDLMQSVSTELRDAWLRIGQIAGQALMAEDHMPGFFDRLLGRGY